MDASAHIPTRLDQILRESGAEPLDRALAGKFAQYYDLLVRWNARTNLTSVRDEDSILSRHFAECIAAARLLPPNIGTLLDLGSGAGFPGIPIALCRLAIRVTLAESQNKKAAFLHEAVRVLNLPATVHAGRAETLTLRFDCVTLRAVDRMQQAIGAATQLLNPHGVLAILTSTGELASVQKAASESIDWQLPVRLPGSTDRVLLLGSRT